MSANLPDPILDEQYLQRVLSAAFTIQEENDSDARKSARAVPPPQVQAAPETRSELEPVPSDWELELMCSGMYTEPACDRAEVIDQSIPKTIPDPATSNLGPVHSKATEDTAPDENHDSGDASSELLNCFPHNFLAEVVGQALQVTHATGAAIAFREHGRLVCRSVSGYSASQIDDMINAPSGLTGISASRGTIQMCSNTGLTKTDADACRRFRARAILAVSLLHNLRSVGLIAVFSQRPYAFGKRDLRALEDLAERLMARMAFSRPS